MIDGNGRMRGHLDRGRGKQEQKIQVREHLMLLINIFSI